MAPRGVGLLVAALAVLVVSSGIAAADPGRSARPVVDLQLQQLILQEINVVRDSNGAPALHENAALDAAAAQHTTEMASNGYFGHASLDGTPFPQRLNAYYGRHGKRQWAVAENLFWGTADATADEALKVWLQSQIHRANLLNATWRDVGVSAVHVSAVAGAFEDDEVVIVTADFGFRR